MNPTRASILLSALAFSLAAGSLWAQRGGQGGPPAAAPIERPAERRMNDRDMRPDQDRVREHAPAQAQREHAPAQPDRPYRHSLAERLETRAEWCRELGLNEQQQNRIQQIREHQRQEIQAVERRWLITRNQRQERIREIIARHDQEVHGVLTQDQRRLLETLQLRDQEQLRIRDQIQSPPQR